MASKNRPDNKGFVYSTDPDFQFDQGKSSGKETIPPNQQKLRILLDTRQRAGKSVTVVVGFTGKNSDLEALGKKLKAHCGSGGTVKDGDIIIQGDQREKVKQWLSRNGYNAL
jgi:translation initiation factor 1